MEVLGTPGARLGRLFAWGLVPGGSGEGRSGGVQEGEESTLTQVRRSRQVHSFR